MHKGKDCCINNFIIRLNWILRCSNHRIHQPSCCTNFSCFIITSNLSFGILIITKHCSRFCRKCSRFSTIKCCCFYPTISCLIYPSFIIRLRSSNSSRTINMGITSCCPIFMGIITPIRISPHNCLITKCSNCSMVINPR